MKHIFFTFLVFFLHQIKAQEKYPKDAFISPMGIPLLLAGNFGELRSNHFHSGLDIKTQQREGLPVNAIAEGMVTRIKVGIAGYGKVIYMAHPNGHTSVYAHLQKFSPEVEAYVKKNQYQKKMYEIEVFPDFGELKLNQGDLIAYSGNTGSSSGPHLHFEIRNTLSENPINPLLYGLDVKDSTAPVLSNLYGYALAPESQINQSDYKIQLKFTKQADGTLLAEKVKATGTIGFGFSGYDRHDLAANQNGIYSVQQLVNGKVYSEYDFDTFSFDETRYINTLIDYEHYVTTRQHIQKCFKDPGNKLTIYQTLFNDGKILVEEGLSYNVEIILKDLDNNYTKLVIPVVGKREELKLKKKEVITENYILSKKPNNFDLGGAKVYFPANTFYDDFFMDLKKGKDTVTIHNGKIAAHNNFTITFDVSRYSEEERKQLFIGRLDGRRRPIYNNTHKRGDTFTTRTRNLGTYLLEKDSTPPQIRSKNFKDKQWLNNYRYLSLEIKDDLSGIDTYNATLNGEWILMEYERKTNTLTYNFDDLQSNKNQFELVIVVTDNVGNSSTFTSTFYRN